MRSLRLTLILILVGIAFLLGGLLSPTEPAHDGLAAQLGPRGTEWTMLAVGAASLATGLVLLRRGYRRARVATSNAPAPNRVVVVAVAGAIAVLALLAAVVVAHLH